MTALQALSDTQYDAIDRALAQLPDMQSTVPMTKATCSTCLLRQDKLVEQLPALQACLPPEQRFGTSCSILNDAFVVVQQAPVEGDAADLDAPFISQVLSLQLPGDGQGPLQAQLKLDDGSVVRLLDVVDLPTTDPQMGLMVADLAEAQRQGIVPTLTLHTLVHTLCRLAALHHLTSLVSQAQGLLEGENPQQQYSTLQELRCTVGEAVQYVSQGPGFKVRLQLARKAQAAAGGGTAQHTNGTAGSGAAAADSAPAKAASGGGAPAMNGGGHGEQHVQQRPHQQRQHQQDKQQPSNKQRDLPSSTANGTAGFDGSPLYPDMEHLPDPGTPRGIPAQQQQQQQQDQHRHVYSPNYTSTAVDPEQAPPDPFTMDEPEAPELEWDPAAAGPSDLPHLKAAAAVTAAAAKAGHRGASAAQQQQEGEEQQESDHQEDWLTALCGAGILPPGDLEGQGPATPVAAPGDVVAPGATGDALHGGDDELPPPVDWTEDLAGQPTAMDVGAAVVQAAAVNPAGVAGAGGRQQQQQQQGVKRKPPPSGSGLAQPAGKRQQPLPQRPATASNAAAGAGAAEGQDPGTTSSSSRQQAGDRRTSEQGHTVQGTPGRSQALGASGQPPQTAPGDKGVTAGSRGPPSTSAGEPKAAPGTSRSGDRPRIPSAPAGRGRGRSRSPPPLRRRPSPAPRSRGSRTPPRSPRGGVSPSRRPRSRSPVMRMGGSPRPRRRSSPGPRPVGRRSRSPQQQQQQQRPGRGPRRSRSRSPVLGPRAESRSQWRRDVEGQQSCGSRGRGEEERRDALRGARPPVGARRVDHYSPSPDPHSRLGSPAGTDPGAAGSTGGAASTRVCAPFGAASMPAMAGDPSMGGPIDFPGAHVPPQQQMGGANGMMYDAGYNQQHMAAQYPAPAGGVAGGWGGAQQQQQQQWVDAGVAEVLAAATGPAPVAAAAAAGHSSHYRQLLAAGMPVADLSLAQLHATASSHTIYYNQLQEQQQRRYGMHPGSRDQPHQYAGQPQNDGGRGRAGGAGVYSGYEKPGWLRQPDAAGQQQHLALQQPQPEGWAVGGGRQWQPGPLEPPQPSPASQLEPSPRPRVYERLSGLADPLPHQEQRGGQEELQRLPSVFGRLQQLSIPGDDAGVLSPRYSGPDSREGAGNSSGPWTGAGRGGSREEEQAGGSAASGPEVYIAQVVEVLRGRNGQCMPLGDLHKVLPVPKHFMSEKTGVYKFLGRYPQLHVDKHRGLLSLASDARGDAGDERQSLQGRPGQGTEEQRRGRFDRRADPPPPPHMQQDRGALDGGHWPGSPATGDPPARPSGPQLHFMVKNLSHAITQHMEERGLQRSHLQRDVWPLMPDELRPLLDPDGPVTLQKFAEDYLLFFDVVMVEEQVRGRWMRVPYLEQRSYPWKAREACKYWKGYMMGGCRKAATCTYKHNLAG